MAKELAALGSLSVEFALAYSWIKSIHITDMADEHGQMELHLVSSAMLSPADVLPLEDAPVKVADPDGDAIFVGVCQSVGLANEANYSEIIIQAKSLSMQADRKKNSRTFQNPAKKLSEVANTVMAEYGITVEVKDDITVEQMLYQDAETDWAFLRRVANQFGCLLFTDSKADLMRVAIGTFPFAHKTLGPESAMADIDKNILSYIKIRENTSPEAQPYEFERAKRTSYDLTIGAGYMVDCAGDRTRYSVKSEIRSHRFTVENHLTLAHEEGCKPESKAAAGRLNSSDFITGTVLEVQGTMVKVHFSCDESQSADSAMWMPYENTMNNYIYSMPDVGDTVFVYYENNGKAVCLGSRRSNGGTHQDFSDPASKSLTSTNKMLKFTPATAELVASRAAYDKGGGSQSLIKCDGESGVTVQSTQDISIVADKTLIIQAADEKVEVKTFDEFNQRHLAGEFTYIAGGGSPSKNPAEELLDNIGAEVDETFKKGVAATISAIPGLVSHIMMNMVGGGGAGAGSEDANAPKEEERPPDGSLHLKGMENCRFEVEDSELEITPDLIKFTTPVYRQMGFKQGAHDMEKAEVEEEEEEAEAEPEESSALDTTQAVLDVVGFLPVVGTAADLANAAISVARGNYFEAACSAVSAIPFVGKFLGKGAKALKAATKAGKAAKGAAKAAKALKKGKKLKKLGKGLKKVKALMNGAKKSPAALKKMKGVDKAAGKVRRIKGARKGEKAWGLTKKTTKSAAKKSKKVRKPRVKSSGKNAPKQVKGKGSPAASGKNPKRCTSDGDPVDVVTGSFVMEMTDFVLRDISTDFILKRTYESVHENPRQHLGSRWLLNVGSRVERIEDKAVVLMEDMKLEKFEKVGGVWQNERGGDQALIFTEVEDGYELKFIAAKKTYSYDEFGKLTAITDRNGNRTEIRYRGSAIETIALASGQTLTFAYERDKIRRITDTIGRSVEYRYEDDLLTEVTYPNDGTVRYAYTEEGWISQITDQNGIPYVQNSYDSKGRVIRQTMPNNGEFLYFYQDDDRTTTVTSPHNNETVSYVYNRQKLVVSIIYNDQTTEEYKYDDKENIIWKKDRNGQVTTYQYNAQSQRTEKRYANGWIRGCAYDADGNLLEERDNAGKEIRYTYDKNGNVVEERTRIDNARWAVKAYAYDARGRMISCTDERGHSTQYIYRGNQSDPARVITPGGDSFDYEYDQAGRNMAIVSPLGRKEYAYNNIDYRTMEIDALGNTTKYEYDKLCNLVKEIRPNQYNEKTNAGKAWRYVYDAMDEVEKRISPLGHTIATPRDAEENIVKEINPNTYDELTRDGKGIENIWDPDNRKIKIIYPDGGIERIKYDANGNIIKRIQPEEYDEESDDGAGYTYTYDEVNRLVQICAPDQTVEKRYVYDLAGNIIKEIDAKGCAEECDDAQRIGTLYSYNQIGWLTEKRVPLRKEAGQTKYQVTQYQYDESGNVTEERRIIDEQDETSASGRVLRIKFSYDEMNRLIEVRDNEGAVVHYQYNCLNQKIYEKRKINEQTHQVVRCQYDAAGRLIEMTERADREGSGAFTAVTKYTLDKTGNVIKIKTPSGCTIEREYDEADRLISETHKDKENGIENRTEISYDKAGNIVKIKDANGAEETYAYDLLNRETKRTGKNGGTEKSDYDKNGRLIRKITAKENEEKGEAANGNRYTYDVKGRIVTIIGPDGKIIETNVYDEAGRIKQKLDAAKSGVNYDYDLAGRIERIRSEGGTKQEYEYDARGNITGIVDGNKNRTEYKLDKWGRITEIRKADGTKEYYGYDSAGNITSSTDGEGNRIEYAYNRINKLEEIRDQAGKTEKFYYDIEGRLREHRDRNGNRVRYSYNLYGSITEKEEVSSGLRESYEYSKDGRLKAAIAEGMRYGYSYYADGKLKEKTASGKTLLSYVYDLNGNKTKQTDVTGKTTEYRYDENDWLKEIREEGKSIVRFAHNEDGTVKEAISANGMKTAYGYDIDKNIESLNITLNGKELARNRYSYDGNGNRKEKEQLRGTTKYSYDSVNRLVKAQYPESAEELYYDRAGNRTKRIANGVEEKYRYDVRNRLTSHEKEGVETRYQYDEAGNLREDGDKRYQYDGFNRTTKVETKNGQVQVNRYDAEGLRHEIEENGKLVQFIYNENREVVTEKTERNLKRLIRSYDLWASECTQEKTWYHYASDEQGSIVYVADEEEVKNRYEYDAWGNTTESEEQVENRYRYTGQQLDPVTQQYYLRARYYNPVIARFTQEDEYRGDGLNLYAYCDNNPVMYYDPSGYMCGSKDPVGKKTKSSKIYNKNGDAYPEIIDPRTGKNIEFPEGPLDRVPKDQRVEWNNDRRGDYIKEWYERGYETPEGGWEKYDVHHIRPREFGGNNSFDNLVPVERRLHQTKFNPFWFGY